MDSWTATQVRALAATGLSSSHLKPFTRLLYHDPKHHKARSRSVLVESSATSDELVCRRHRERHGKYTATWSSADTVHSGELFNVHAAVDCVELQLWNQFDNGFEVFLGKASVSLRHLHRQCSESQTRNDKLLDTMATGALWFPLQISESGGLSSQMSLQVECIFVSDPKVLRIHEAIRRRKKKARRPRKSKRDRSEDKHEPSSGSDDESDDHRENEIVDPVFAFAQPSLPVDWSLIAGTSIRQLFFHAEIERLADFRELVLYGDMDRQLDKDEDLQIHDDHLAAFKLCQYSAQYLDHCVHSLSQRLQDYSDEYRVLTDTHSRLARKNRSLKAQRQCLQKEHDDLDLLITTYQRVLEKNGGKKLPEDQLRPPSSPVKGTLSPSRLSESAHASPPVSPTNSLSSKKPVFLKTWEEREHERRLEKEISKAQRIEEEKQRLNLRALERQRRDAFEAFVAKVAEKRQQHAAKVIQAFFREVTNRLGVQRHEETNHAATLIQSVWRRFVNVKEYPHRLETRKQQQELELMAQNEHELRRWLADMRQKDQAAQADIVPPPEPETSEHTPSPAPSPSKEVVDALVSTWRRLHRVFVLAHTTRGIEFAELFSQMDLRKDDVIDRAELRLGARSFGVRLNRQITRALIALIRTKCGDPSKPLLMTFAQFVRGFELKQNVTATVRTKPPPLAIERDNNKVIAPNPSRNPGETTSDKDKNQDTSEEALVEAVRGFRKAVYDAAMAHLISLGKSTTDYRAFREALTGMFRDFDADKDGHLDVNELAACMAAFNLQLTNDNASLLRELFVGYHESDSIGVTEFISFVLAHSSSKAERHDEDELGLLGYRLREAISSRVQQAQTQSESVDEAVRIVFRVAYHRKGQQSCSIRDFVRTLKRLRLGVPSAQLALLAVRLDRDGDHSISFNELLLWLRVRSTKEFSTFPSETVMSSKSALQFATRKAKAIRLLLAKLAAEVSSSGANKTDLIALFRRIDQNDSGKVNQEELQTFLEAQNLSAIVGEETLEQIFGPSAPLPHNALTPIAKEMMGFLDLNANGVVTLQEWLTFAQHETEDDDDPVVIDAIRKALKDSHDNDPELLGNWFSSLPGAMQAATRPNESAQVKMRAAEFKTALRAQLGGSRFVSLHAIDRVVENLDKDASGWITTSELSGWAFPTRDLEEILRLVIKRWQPERLGEPNRAEFALKLYKQFDTDGNGSLAMRELLSGFAIFGVRLTEYETRVLLISFDTDGDGCWSRAEFLAFVDKLFPIATLPETLGQDEAVTTATNDLPVHNDSDSNGDDQLLLNPSSLQASSNEDKASVLPVEYSEDFDESGAGKFLGGNPVPESPAHGITTKSARTTNLPAHNGSIYSDGDLLLDSGSSNPSSLLASSNGDNFAALPVEYSEDFDEG